MNSQSMQSRVAQWKRAGPITQRSVDRNYALLAALGSQFQIYCLSSTGYNNASEKGF